MKQTSRKTLVVTYGSDLKLRYYILHLKKLTFSNIPVNFKTLRVFTWHLIWRNTRTADIVFGRKSFPPIRCSVSRRVHFQTWSRRSIWHQWLIFFLLHTTDLVNNAKECDRRPGKSACWGKILFYDVCKWQSLFSLQSKIVFRLTFIRARTDCTVRLFLSPINFNVLVDTCINFLII